MGGESRGGKRKTWDAALFEDVNAKTFVRVANFDDIKNF